MDIGRSPYRRTPGARQRFQHIQDSIQSHAIRALQCTGYLREVDGSSPTGVTVVPLPCILRRYHLLWDDIRGCTGQPDINFRTSALLRTAVEVNKVSSVLDVCTFFGTCRWKEGTRVRPRKITDVKSWPVPDCLKSVRQFLGFVGYYRRFIPNFADLAEPLVSLTGKDVPFVWRPACVTAFTGLRDALVRAQILAFTTEQGDYILDTDASNFGLGGVLSQIQDNVEGVIAYCSRGLRPSQRKYCTTKREMLAAVSMCIQFRSYLRGAKFTLRTDHKSLVWLHCFKDTEGMMAHWLHTLQQFQFSIVHRAGRDHGNADGLSRAPANSVLVPTAPPWIRP